MLFDILLRYQEPEEHFIVLAWWKCFLPNTQSRNAPCSRLPLLPCYEQFPQLCVAAPFAIAGLSLVPNGLLKPLHFASPGACPGPFATCGLRAVTVWPRRGVRGWRGVEGWGEHQEGLGRIRTVITGLGSSGGQLELAEAVTNPTAGPGGTGRLNRKGRGWGVTMQGHGAVLGWSQPSLC